MMSDDEPMSKIKTLTCTIAGYRTINKQALRRQCLDIAHDILMTHDIKLLQERTDEPSVSWPFPWLKT